MIHILVGNDIKNKNLYIKELTSKSGSFFVTPNDLNNEFIMSYSSGENLFGQSPSLILDGVLSSNIVIFSDTEFNILKESKTLFIFKEDKMLSADQKKFKKYAEIKSFEEKTKPTIEKFNIFSITDAFASKDKINTWVLYHKAISSGVEPEAIAGVFFWKIKTMVINGSKVFSKNELKRQLSEIVSLYHMSHKGELDFNIGLEQFILNSLSTK